MPGSTDLLPPEELDAPLSIPLCFRPNACAAEEQQGANVDSDTGNKPAVDNIIISAGSASVADILMMLADGRPKRRRVTTEKSQGMLTIACFDDI